MEADSLMQITSASLKFSKALKANLNQVHLKIKRSEAISEVKAQLLARISATEFASKSAHEEQQ